MLFRKIPKLFELLKQATTYTTTATQINGIKIGKSMEMMFDILDKSTVCEENLIFMQL